MSHIVTLPPLGLRDDGTKAGGWWHAIEGENRIACDLCPRDCRLKPGDRGFCFVRENRGGEMVLTTYGRSTGFCVDPIEKKPLNHFYPGTSVLSFGTAGCNLGCKFCQNWDISKSREIERLSELATPEAIAAAALKLGCRSVAFTYNDPVIWAEYAIDVAAACRAVGVKTVAVTAGYITPAARGPFYQAMDAANVDLKAFTEQFYYQMTLSHLEPVLETLRWLKHESDVWFEITNLMIPQANDAPEEIERMSGWILDNLGDEVPIHFTAFHPDFRLRDRPATPHETLVMAYDIARRAGIKYVYTGNVHDLQRQSTYCGECGGLLIQRDWYALGVYNLKGNRCGHCGVVIPGRFDDAPGNWGPRRLPVQISQYSSTATSSARSLPVVSLNQIEPVMPATNANPNQTPASIDVCPNLSADQQAAIHRAACELMTAEICHRPARISDSTLAGAARTIVMGAFVTAKRKGRLRGCCGVLGEPIRIIDALTNAAARTATQDIRLPPISPSELAYLEIDVTLLYGFRDVTSRGQQRIQDVQVGKHGLQIQRGADGGLLLPSVAVENHWDAAEFLQQVCRKARLPVTAWQDDVTRLRTFEGSMIEGEFDRAALPESTELTMLVIRPQEIRTLALYVASNVAALLRGATPTYYAPGISDGAVNGIAITLRPAGKDESQHIGQISLRPGLPLQSSLFTLTEMAARIVRSSAATGDDVDLAIGVTVLTDTAMHGTVASPDFDGFDPQTRALLLKENNKSPWTFQPGKTAGQILEELTKCAQVVNPAAASLFSLAAVSTESAVTVSNVPRPTSGAAIRPAAVAGSFYPNDADELGRLVDSCFSGLPNARAKHWPAVMVPHAGLKYSGRIAAKVFQQVQIPDTVIVIGPKHTRLGAAYAVAPHERWTIPGAVIESDRSLAEELVAEIPALVLDAAAHEKEHGIEVELPLLARVAPRARVVGIAIGAGDFDACREIAAGLARLMMRRKSRPLLVISSDMNHFATDQENRRLDEIALSALDRLDPAGLYETVTKNQISMCGVLPAVIVLETLRQLGTLKKAQRVAYGTSADVTGDTSRVVGYAGMLFG